MSSLGILGGAALLLALKREGSKTEKKMSHEVDFMD
jgi:hypothetical protein